VALGSQAASLRHMPVAYHHHARRLVTARHFSISPAFVIALASHAVLPAFSGREPEADAFRDRVTTLIRQITGIDLTEEDADSD